MGTGIHPNPLGGVSMTIPVEEAVPRVLIVPQPRFPVPATLGNAATATIIDNTLLNIPKHAFVWALSLTDQKKIHVEVDPIRYHIVARNGVGFRVLRRLLLKMPIHRHFDGFTGKDRDYLTALYLEVIRHRPDILVIHTTKMLWALRIKEIFTNKKVVVYHHNSEGHLVSDELFRALVTGIDAHIFVSSSAQQAFKCKAATSGLKEPRTFTIHNGIDIDFFIPDPAKRTAFRKRLGISEERLVVLFCGRLIERKGLHRLFEAIKMLNSDVRDCIEVLVAGAEDYHGRQNTQYINMLVQRAAEPSLKGKIKFLGYVPRYETPALYAASDMFIFPSIELEGLPLVNLEAQAMMLPVVASDIGGVSESIIPGETGFLVTPPGDAKQIALYITKLVKDRMLLRQMGTAARRHVSASFSCQRMAADFMESMTIVGSEDFRILPSVRVVGSAPQEKPC